MRLHAQAPLLVFHRRRQNLLAAHFVASHRRRCFVLLFFLATTPVVARDGASRRVHGGGVEDVPGRGDFAHAEETIAAALHERRQLFRRLLDLHPVNEFAHRVAQLTSHDNLRGRLVSIELVSLVDQRCDDLPLEGL